MKKKLHLNKLKVANLQVQLKIIGGRGENSGTLDTCVNCGDQTVLYNNCKTKEFGNCDDTKGSIGRGIPTRDYKCKTEINCTTPSL